MEWQGLFNGSATNRLVDSAIASIMKIASEENAMSLAAGEPFGALYPAEELRDCLMISFSKELPVWGYSNSRTGIAPLRQWIADWMARDGLLPQWANSDSLFITNGSQEGLYLLCECLLEPGDTVIVESPSYPEAFGIFRKFGAKCLSVPLSEEGPDIGVLEGILKENRVKFFYTIPTYQNPTGFSTPDSKKQSVLDLALRHGFVIIEDDPYRNLSFEGRPEGTYIRASGDKKNVAYLGSFSKIVAPGLRCGWVVAPQPVIEKMLKIRIMGTLCLPEILHYGLWEFVNSIDLTEYLEGLSRTYRQHRDALVSSLMRHAGPHGLELAVPKGGFFLWGRVPWIEDMKSFALYAIREEKIAVIPGKEFFLGGHVEEDTVRLSFSKVTPSMAEECARRLGTALKRFRDL